ncbi:MAG: hypothetical protein K6U08_07845 [Firmicutes bacterium]|nr:hypothetical protein [Bacillota bacterium]
MMKPVSGGIKRALGILVVLAVLVSAGATTALAAVPGDELDLLLELEEPSPEGSGDVLEPPAPPEGPPGEGDQGAPGGPGVPGAPGAVPGRGPAARPIPPITKEQEQLLDRAQELVGELRAILRDAAEAVTMKNWRQVQIELLDYVATVVELEKTLDAFVAATPEGKRCPVRLYVGPILADVAAQADEVARIWEALPLEYRTPVKEALRRAVEASDHKAFWKHLIRIMADRPGDPGSRIERLEAALARAQERLEAVQARLGKLEEHKAALEEKLAQATDPTQQDRLEDLLGLVELDIAACKARIAREEYAIRMFQDWLEELRSSGIEDATG